MRRDDDVGKLDQRIVWIAGFFVKRIESIAAQATLIESFTQRYAVDEIGLRYIDQESAGLDERKLALEDSPKKFLPSSCITATTSGWTRSPGFVPADSALAMAGSASLLKNAAAICERPALRTHAKMMVFTLPRSPRRIPGAAEP